MTLVYFPAIVKLALPSKKTIAKWALGLLGGILVSALGSAVWQSILEPTLHILARALLNIASLGLSSYKNSIYLRIAVDDQSVSAFDALADVTAVKTIIVFAVVGWQFVRNAEIRRDNERLLKRFEEPSPTHTAEVSLGTPQRTIERILSLSKRARRLSYVICAVATFIVVSDFIVLARISYVSSADAHYHQVLRIAATNLDAHEKAQIEADFAQINSREDYVKVLSSLEGTCKAHGQTFPAFKPW